VASNTASLAWGSDVIILAVSRMGGPVRGLVISRRFCQMMGGDITVESTPGRTDIKSVKELLPIEVEHKQCYRVYFAEFRRKSRLTMGVLPGLACASILNTNSSCPSWLSWLIR
jgi:hypothetical protein